MTILNTNRDFNDGKKDKVETSSLISRSDMHSKSFISLSHNLSRNGSLDKGGRWLHLSHLLNLISTRFSMEESQLENVTPE